MSGSRGRPAFCWLQEFHPAWLGSLGTLGQDRTWWVSMVDKRHLWPPAAHIHTFVWYNLEPGALHDPGPPGRLHFTRVIALFPTLVAAYLAPCLLITFQKTTATLPRADLGTWSAQGHPRQRGQKTVRIQRHPQSSLDDWREKAARSLAYLADSEATAVGSFQQCFTSAWPRGLRALCCWEECRVSHVSRS